jgi:UDPglucose--hexose-1-phosphate uridylyltransferase
MSTLRRDPVVGRWVINTDKSEPSPTALDKLDSSGKNAGGCPLCSGNEDRTPPEIFAIRPRESKQDGGDWEVRVIPKFTTAMQRDGELRRRAELMYDLMDSIGAYEMVVESPNHVTDMADLPEPQITSVLLAYRERFLRLKEDERYRTVFVYKTQPPKNGEIVRPHTHSFIVATPMTPKSIKEQYVGSMKYYQYKERCIYCDIIRQETEEGKRIISENEKFIAITPFASKYSYEVWILPRDHCCDFEGCQEKDLPYLSSIIKSVLMRLRALLDDPPYYYALISGPNRKGREGYWETIEADYHWHMEIAPAVSHMNGFEWATGFYINRTTPETAAKQLRDIKI